MAASTLRSPFAGENHHAAKITQAGVDEIRADHAGGMSFSKLHLKYGPRWDLSYDQIRRIARGQAWKE